VHDLNLLNAMEQKNKDVQSNSVDIQTKQSKTTAKETTSPLLQLVNTENEKRNLINVFIEKSLKDGVDYGSINVRGTNSKPSLFKPGSEKMCSLFGLTPRFERDEDTWEMLGKKAGLVTYKCELVDAKGNVVGEGRGTAITNLQSDFDVNKQVKIAQKRAQIDAVLRVFALSERFTQDMEDLPKQGDSNLTVTKDSKVLANPLASNLQEDKKLDRWNTKIRYLYKLMHEAKGEKDIETMKQAILNKYGLEYMNQLTENELDEVIVSMEPQGKLI
jgi:hypothetical protein